VGLVTTTISGSTAVFGTEFQGNKIFAFFPSTGMINEWALPNPNSGPEYIAVEPSGADPRVWFTEVTRNSIGELIYHPAPAAANVYEDTLPAAAGGGANGVYATSGVVWFAGFDAILKWDRSTDQYSIWPTPTHGSANAGFIGLDSLNQVWYTQGVTSASGTDNYIGVLRGDNTFKDWQIPTTGADPRVLSINPITQQPWVAEYAYQANDGKIAVLDPSAGGTATGFVAPSNAPSPSALTNVPPSTSGPLPVSANVVAPASATNIGTTTGQFTEWTLAANSEPHDVIVDSSGTTWFLESTANKLGRLTVSTPDFTLSPSPGTISIPQGGSGSITITGTSVLSYAGAATLSITGSVPSGVSFTFSPNPINIPSGGTAAATLTINVGGSASTGTSTITVSGTGGPTHTTTFDLTITSGADFSLALSSSALTVGSGSSGTDTVTATSFGGFNSAVNLATSGALPGGVHVGFSPSSVTPPPGGSAASTATISVDAGTPAQTTAITITGTSGSLTHSQTLTVTITLTPDFTIGASPSSLSIALGGSGTSNINVGSTNGFSSAVTLTYSWVGTAPSGATISLPGPVTPPSGGTATSTLTVTLTAGASSGTYTLAVTGTSGALTHSTNIGVIIGSGTATTTSTPGGPSCLIATATYGSELSPEVQLLRSFRDNSILKTSAGSGFMIAFNTWYYSFSPSVASYVGSHGVERAIMKVLLYPAVGIMSISSSVFSATSAFPELAAVLSGLLASSLVGAFYIGLPLSLVRAKVRRVRGWERQKMLQKALGAVLMIGLAGVLLAELIPYSPLMIGATTTTILATLVLAALVTSATVSKRLANVYLRFR
jgi:streptogramin lyase